MTKVQSVDAKVVFVVVGDANVHHSELLKSVSPTDRLGRDALDFCNLPDGEQLVRWPTHIAGNRHDLVKMDVHDSRCVCWYSTVNFTSLLCQLCASV